MAQANDQSRFELLNGTAGMIGQFGGVSASDDDINTSRVSIGIGARGGGKKGSSKDEPGWIEKGAGEVMGFITKGGVAGKIVGELLSAVKADANQEWANRDVDGTSTNLVRGHLEGAWQQLDTLARAEAMGEARVASPSGGFDQAVFNREYAGRMTEYYAAASGAAYEALRGQAMVGAQEEGRLPETTPSPSASGSPGGDPDPQAFLPERWRR